MSSLVCNYWYKRELKINTNFAVNVWMLCVITDIHKDANENSDGYHSKQVNTVIKTLFYVSFEVELHVTIDLFCNEYNDSDHNNGTLDGD